jgi:hypothetical protein
MRGTQWDRDEFLQMTNHQYNVIISLDRIPDSKGGLAEGTPVGSLVVTSYDDFIKDGVLL